MDNRKIETTHSIDFTFYERKSTSSFFPQEKYNKYYNIKINYDSTILTMQHSRISESIFTYRENQNIKCLILNSIIIQYQFMNSSNNLLLLLDDGAIQLYRLNENGDSWEQMLVIGNHEFGNAIILSETDDLIASSCSYKQIVLWKKQHQNLWFKIIQFNNQQNRVSLNSTYQFLLAEFDQFPPSVSVSTLYQSIGKRIIIIYKFKNIDTFSQTFGDCRIINTKRHPFSLTIFRINKYGKRLISKRLIQEPIEPYSMKYCSKRNLLFLVNKYKMVWLVSEQSTNFQGDLIGCDDLAISQNGELVTEFNEKQIRYFKVTKG